MPAGALSSERVTASSKPPTRSNDTFTGIVEPGAAVPALEDALNEKSGIARKAPIQTAFSWVLSGSVFVRQSSVPTASRAMRTCCGDALGNIVL